MKRLFILLIGAFCLFIQEGYAQEEKSNNRKFYVPFSDNHLVETKWQYTYTLHLESNTVLHQADDAYQYYLYFKYNFTYERFLNGDLNKGVWGLNANELEYQFKNIAQFDIVEIDNNMLVLEFNESNSTGTYQHHFIQVDDEDAPFVKPDNELPVVKVESDNGKSYKKRKKKKKWSLMDWLFGGKDEEPKEELVYISIDMYGGGYYGGMDPVIKDFIQIKNDGRIIKEFCSVNQGEIITKTYVPREELELFAEYIQEHKFFEMERIYDCSDSFCQKRKHQKPKPVPLRIAVTYGDQSKVVTLPIWGRDKRIGHNDKYINYPPAIDNIVLSIQKMAARINKGSVAAKYEF